MIFKRISMLRIQDFQFNPFQTNCYVVWDDSKECAIIDPAPLPGRETDILADFVAAQGLTPKAILLTHGHGDHALGVAECLRHWDVPVYMNSADRDICRQHAKMCAQMGMGQLDSEFPATDVKEEDKIAFGGHEFIVIETPGHTPGGVSYLCIEEKVLFSGDTLFRGTIGRTDLPGGDFDEILKSLNGKLLGLAGDIEVFPGHGPSTSIAEEVQSNPFLQPFNEEVDMDEAAANAIAPTFKR